MSVYAEDIQPSQIHSLGLDSSSTTSNISDLRAINLKSSTIHLVVPTNKPTGQTFTVCMIGNLAGRIEYFNHCQVTATVLYLVGPLTVAGTAEEGLKVISFLNTLITNGRFKRILITGSHVDKFLYNEDNMEPKASTVSFAQHAQTVVNENMNRLLGRSFVGHEAQVNKVLCKHGIDTDCIFQYQDWNEEDNLQHVQDNIHCHVYLTNTLPRTILDVAPLLKSPKYLNHSKSDHVVANKNELVHHGSDHLLQTISRWLTSSEISSSNVEQSKPQHLCPKIVVGALVDNSFGQSYVYHINDQSLIVDETEGEPTPRTIHCDTDPGIVVCNIVPFCDDGICLQPTMIHVQSVYSPTFVPLKTPTPIVTQKVDPINRQETSSRYKADHLNQYDTVAMNIAQQQLNDRRQYKQ